MRNGHALIDILVPFEQEGTKAIVRSWLRSVGDRVSIDDPLVELETDKVTQEVPSPGEGILEEILLSTDADAEPGAVLGRLRALEDGPRQEPDPARMVPDLKATAQPRNVLEQRLSPSVRRALHQHRIDPSELRGSGRGGRITRSDVQRFVEARSGDAAGAVEPAERENDDRVAPLSAPTTSRSIPHDRMRVAIAENMLNSVTVAPHVTAMFEADFSAILAHRDRNRSAFRAAGANLTLTAYVLAACAEAMKTSPAINSRWHDDRLELYDAVNIGVGTALADKGLVVPVVTGVQELSLLGIAQRLTDLTGRARESKLTPSDMRGGTFTVSNHGVSGSLFAAPVIIAQPQSAILGVGKLEKRVVVREIDGFDTIQIRPLCYVSLTIDHRVVDGHQTNAWLSRFVQLIEEWPLDP